MTDLNNTLPPALRGALELLADPPAKPDVSKGYLDLLGTGPAEDQAAKNTGAIQALWASPVGSMLDDHAQAVARRLLAAWQEPTEWLNIPQGGSALDGLPVPVTSPPRWHAPRGRRSRPKTCREGSRRARPRRRG